MKGISYPFFSSSDYNYVQNNEIDINNKSYNKNNKLLSHSGSVPLYKFNQITNSNNINKPSPYIKNNNNHLITPYINRYNYNTPSKENLFHKNINICLPSSRQIIVNDNNNCSNNKKILSMTNSIGDKNFIDFRNQYYNYSSSSSSLSSLSSSSNYSNEEKHLRKKNRKLKLLLKKQKEKMNDLFNKKMKYKYKLLNHNNSELLSDMNGINTNIRNHLENSNDSVRHKLKEVNKECNKLKSSLCNRINNLSLQQKQNLIDLCSLIALNNKNKKNEMEMLRKRQQDLENFEESKRQYEIKVQKRILEEVNKQREIDSKRHEEEINFLKNKYENAERETFKIINELKIQQIKDEKSIKNKAENYFNDLIDEYYDNEPNDKIVTHLPCIPPPRKSPIDEMINMFLARKIFGSGCKCNCRERSILCVPKNLSPILLDDNNKIRVKKVHLSNNYVKDKNKINSYHYKYDSSKKMKKNKKYKLLVKK